MRNLIWVLLAGTVFLAFVAAPLERSFTLKQVSVRFEGKHASGTLNALTGTLRFDPLAPQNSRFEVQLPLAKLDAGASTENALSADWLDAARFPHITFVSSTCTAAGSGFELQGDLTLHGQTRPVRIPFTYAEKGKKASFQGTLQIARRDFGVNMPGDVADTLNVTIAVHTAVK
jgi:polyisoprenoid-binding protein YceI